MNNKRNSIVGLFILILGIIIGYYLGNEEEKEPYCVWAEKDGFIYVVQNPNSYVYNFGSMGDGSYELISVLGPNSPAYPSKARAPKNNK